MRLTQIYIYLCVFFCIFFSCKKNTFNIDDINLLDLKFNKTLESTKYSQEIIIGFPSQIELIDDYLWLFRTRGSAALVFDPIVGKEKTLVGNIGQGPSEHIAPYYAGRKGENVLIWDITLRKMFEYRYEVTEDNFDIYPVNQIKLPDVGSLVFYYLHSFQEDIYIGQSAAGTSKNELFFLLNSKLEKIVDFGINPISDKVEDWTNMMGTISSSGNQFVFAAVEYGYIVSYEINDGELNKKWDYFTTIPKFEIKNNKVRWDKENLLGCYDIKMNSKYIFALYSGYSDFDPVEPVPDKLIILDHNGNLVNSYRLDNRCIRIEVDENNLLYALALDPEPQVIKYDLNEILRN